MVHMNWKWERKCEREGEREEGEEGKQTHISNHVKENDFHTQSV